MSEKENRKKLGDIGEALVKEYLEEVGFKVTMSEDYYDRKKDMLADQFTVEVKTCTPFYKNNTFSVYENQWKKCDNTDFLFFVEVPDVSTIKIYDCTNRSEYSLNYRNNKAKRDYNISNMTLVYTKEDPELSVTMQQLSPSKWRRI